MGVLYTISPLDDDVAEFLREIEATVPNFDVVSRNPTPTEVREVCETLTDLNVRYLSPPDHCWQVVIDGKNDPENEPWTILNIEGYTGCDRDPHGIWFEKGWPSLILRIVHSLSAKCGPLVVIPDTGNSPIVVTESDSVEDLLSLWEHTQM